MRTTTRGFESGGADDRWHSLWWPGAGGGAGDRGKRRKARCGSVARSHGEHHGSQRAVGRSGGSRTGSAAAVSSGDGWIESAARRCGTCIRRTSGSTGLPDSQAAECEGVPARELPERLRSADAQCVRDEQLHGGQRGVAEIFRKLERINPSAARSLEERLEETLTVQRLGIGAVLRRKLATTNPIESCLSTVQRVARNVKRWREGDQPLRWTAAGLLEAEKKFRRIKGYQEILLLKERLNPSQIGRA